MHAAVFEHIFGRRSSAPDWPFPISTFFASQNGGTFAAYKLKKH